MVKDTIRLNDLPTELLTKTLNESLGRTNHKITLESTAEFELRYIIQKSRLRTIMMIRRYRHKPLYVEVDVNNRILRDLSEDAKKQAKRQASSDRNNLGLRYGYFFIFYGIFFVATLIATSLEVFRTWLEQTTNQMIFGGAMVSIAVAIFFVIPVIQNRKISALERFDHEILEIVRASLIDLQKSSLGNIKSVK